MFCCDSTTFSDQAISSKSTFIILRVCIAVIFKPKDFVYNKNILFLYHILYKPRDSLRSAMVVAFVDKESHTLAFMY